MSKNRVLEHREYEVLKAISREQPLGARQLYNYLQDANLKMSESTISRILRQLDKQGFTTSKGNKGRVLTEFGEDFVKGLRTEQRWRDNLADLALHTSEDVLDLLHARHAVEAEVVRSLCEKFDEQALTKLEEIHSQHASGVDSFATRQKHAMQFHKTLADSVQNPIVRGLCSVIFDPRFDVLESILDLVTSHCNTNVDSVNEHEVILDAIRKRDSQSAIEAMSQHIKRLTADVTSIVENNETDLITAVLNFNRNNH